MFAEIVIKSARCPASGLAQYIAIRFCSFDIRTRWRIAASCRQQPGQYGKTVGDRCQDEPRPDAFDAVIHGLRFALKDYRYWPLGRFLGIQKLIEISDTLVKGDCLWTPKPA